MRTYALLTRKGHNVFLARKGLDYFHIIDDANAVNEPFDVILMDTSYGETCATIRSRGYKNALFGLIDPDEAFIDFDAQVAISEAFDAVLMKPLNLRMFHEELASFDAMKSSKKAKRNIL
jgi:hypothetical protein